MNKKIVIVPVFCEAHLIKYQIPNIIDTIDPDCIIYNEGMFPAGPESNTIVNDDFIKEYTLGGHGKRGFDYLELKKIIKDAQIKYPNVKIILNEMEYLESSASKNYVYACSNFDALGIKVQEGDYIFPLEGDVFHHEDAKQEIQEYLTQIEPNQGFRSIWIDFVGNQYHAEKSSLKPFILDDEHADPSWADQGRSRKICIRFGDMNTYQGILMNFESQKYDMLFPTDLVTYHYAWWRPDKYKQLRYKQLNRHTSYWKLFENGMNMISENKYLDIDVRPGMGPNSINSTFRYIRFHDIKQPKHVKEHSCYDEELSEDQIQEILKNKTRYIQ